MEERIKELEHQLANKERKDENTTITEQFNHIHKQPNSERNGSKRYSTNHKYHHGYIKKLRKSLHKYKKYLKDPFGNVIN